MKNYIIDDINNFVLSHNTYNKAQVLYVLAGARKLIECDNNPNYRVVKFYCDWALHTKKDRITPNMKYIVQKIYLSAKNQINNPSRLDLRSDTTEFAYLKDFRDELKYLLNNNHIDIGFITDDNKWNQFISYMIKILENQPMVDPIPDVRKIIFLPSADGCVIYRIEFKNPIRNYHYYDYLNVY